jgi:hypothetical protein
MNGNFDVWQRGTTFTPLVDGTITYLADRWRDNAIDDGGTLPTLTRSRQIITSGDIPNAFYYSRLNTNGAGSGFGTNAMHPYYASVENGNRFLCGLNKKVTLSFWAKSDIVGKKLGIYMVQYYGAGGSPSTNEIIVGRTFDLTSTWTKYTHTYTTNTLVGKTFGTNDDDIVIPGFMYMWGSTTGTTFMGTGVAETYVGSGNIDIAQVQLCAGDEALPFQPKSYGQELADCQRYCFQITNDGGTADPWGTGAELSTTQATINMYLPVAMRVRPTSLIASFIAVGHPGLGRINISVTAIDTSSPTCVGVLCTVASGLTVGYACNGVFQTGSTNYIRLEAEL